MKKKLPIGKAIIVSLFAIISFLLFYTIQKLEVLPIKYLILFALVLVILNVFAAVFLYIKKKWIKVISILLYIVIITFGFFGLKYGNKTDEFLNKAFDNYKIESNTYHIMSLAKGNINSLEALNGKSVVYFTFYNDKDKIISKIQEQVVNPDIRPHDDLYDTFINFLVGQYDAIVLTDSLLDILSEQYDNLDTRLKVLYTFDIESKVVENSEESTSQEGTNNSSIPKKHTSINKKDNINIYISGSDSRSKKIYNKSRSDVNMVMSINKHTKTVLLTSIPRDYYVQIHGQTGLKDKLTHSGIYGLNRSKETVADLFDIEIDYAIKVGFSSVIELVDLVGGIEVNSDTEFKSYHMPGWTVKKGVNQMNGAKALAYARERYAYASGDRHRIQNQQQVLTATLSKLMMNKTLLLKYDQIIDSLAKLYITDIPRSVISEYARLQINDMSAWKFISQSVDGKGMLTHTYITPRQKLYVMVPNESTVERAREKIKSVLEA